MTERERLAWLAIIENCLLASEFIGEMDKAEFGEDRRTFYAVTRSLEIVSEATRRLRGEQQARFNEIAWREIETMGNVFRHAYESVAEDRVWDTVHEKVPGLAAIARLAVESPDVRG
jgi:uncharacterized protein with HEPN domain